MLNLRDFRNEDLSTVLMVFGNYELRDDDRETGGIAYNGETLLEFYLEINDENNNISTVESLLDALKECGISTYISPSYKRTYGDTEFASLLAIYENLYDENSRVNREETV